MDELVEKVARAIATSDHMKESGLALTDLWDTPSYRATVTKHAQAAIAAIREAGFEIVKLDDDVAKGGRVMDEEQFVSRLKAMRDDNGGASISKLSASMWSTSRSQSETWWWA